MPYARAVWSPSRPGSNLEPPVLAPIRIPMHSFPLRTLAAEAAALGEDQLTQRVEADATAPVLRHDLEETSLDY
jgi:hypothetical protein